ncbi:Gag-Pol polyprotein [Plecturocebus cupreus]
MPTPTTRHQVREFLGAVGYCRLWILEFAKIAKPLEIEQWTFNKLKTALTTAPVLALPNISKRFRLFVPKGALTQTLGPWSRSVAYLSKRLDPVASGWPACLRSVAATALLVKEADKLTLGQELNVVAPHAVESLLRGAPGKMDVKCPHSSISGLTLGPAPYKVFKDCSFKACRTAARQRARGTHT